MQPQTHHAQLKYGPAERTAQNPFGINYQNVDGNGDLDNHRERFVHLKVGF